MGLGLRLCGRTGGLSWSLKCFVSLDETRESLGNSVNLIPIRYSKHIRITINRHLTISQLTIQISSRSMPDSIFAMHKHSPPSSTFLPRGLVMLHEDRDILAGR